MWSILYVYHVHKIEIQFKFHQYSNEFTFNDFLIKYQIILKLSITNQLILM